MILARLNFSPSTARFVRRLAGIVVSVAMLASCGGGTAQIEPFAPTRMITFGDEWSVITSDGRKYAVNGFLVDNVTRDCNSLPIWTQVVAAFYGFGFPECPVGTGAPATTASIVLSSSVPRINTPASAPTPSSRPR